MKPTTDNLQNSKQKVLVWVQAPVDGQQVDVCYSSITIIVWSMDGEVPLPLW